MARASDGPASSADLGWRSKDLTEKLFSTCNVGYWSGEGFRANGTRTRVVRKLSTTLYRFVRKVKVCRRQSLGAAVWPQLKRGNREPGIIFQKEIACGTQKNNNKKFVEMRNTCQVTNQSSHGELSFHHNPHLRLCWGLGLSTSRVVRRGGSRLKNAAHPTYCHCCEFCALKQKPGVLLENKIWEEGKEEGRSSPLSFSLSNKKKQIPTADRTHHRIRSPSIKCSGT
jgi:hypothetical protein